MTDFLYIRRLARQWVLAAAGLALIGMVLTAAGAGANEMTIKPGVPNTSLVLQTMYVQNLALKFMLSAYGKSEQEQVKAMKEAERAILRFSLQKREMIQVNSREDIEMVRRLYFRHYDSLQDEINEIRQNEPPPFFMLTPGSRAMAEEIESLWREQERSIAEISGAKLSSQALRDQPVLRQIVFGALDTGRLNVTGIENALAAVPDEERAKACRYILSPIEKAVQRIDQIGGLISGHEALAKADPGMRRFVELTIGLYFKHLDTESKMNILSSLLDHLDRTSDMERFQLMTLRSGPNLQKALQILARRKDFGDSMKHVFQQLESAAAPVPWRLIAPEIKKVPVPFEWVSIEKEPLGVGSMAQTHKAKIRLKDGSVADVAVRVLKPGITERIKSEDALLAKIGPMIDSDQTLQKLNFPKLTPLLGQVSQMVVWELDSAATAKRQKQAREVYNEVIDRGTPEEVSFYVPKIYDVPENPILIVQEFVKGMKFEIFSQKYPRQSANVIFKFARQWMKKAMISPGFFHGDPHEGNFSVILTSEGHPKINIYDFGMSGELSHRATSQVLGLAIMLESAEPDLMAKAIWEVSNKTANLLTVQELQDQIASEKAERARQGVKPRDFFEWMAFASDAGIRFPTEFILMNRGTAMLKQELESHHIGKSEKAIMKELVLENPTRLKDAMQSLPFGLQDWMRAGIAAYINHTTNSKSTANQKAPMCRALFAEARGH